MSGAAEYLAVIESTPPGVGPYPYLVTLYHGRRRLNRRVTQTRWGARRWAKRIARAHKSHSPHREEFRFDA